jgi:microcompartment protein CcmK/EutM
MLTAIVEGTVVSTIKDPGLTGIKLLLVRMIEDGKYGKLQVAADQTRQARDDDFVTCISSKEAALIFAHPYPPCDLTITGFIDEYNLEKR